MKPQTTVTITIIYIVLIISALSSLGYFCLTETIHIPDGLLIMVCCVLTGGYGGCLYCLRGVYLNYSVKNQWDSRWLPWYFLRPFASMICGGVSYVFLKAGLLILEAQKETDSTNIGFYALAFIAGLNVDKFIEKLEDLAQSAWGIKKSRASEQQNNNQTDRQI